MFSSYYLTKSAILYFSAYALILIYSSLSFNNWSLLFNLFYKFYASINFVLVSEIYFVSKSELEET